MHRFLRTALVASLLVLPALAACDRVKGALREGPDLQWQGDSALLAANPPILFRLIPFGDTAVEVIPMASYGPQGLHQLHLGNRGWRSFDVNYLQSNASITVIRNGRAAQRIQLTRGMWEPTPFDTTIQCGVPIPVGLAKGLDRQSGIATSQPPKPLRHHNELTAGELQTALDAIPLLIAPAAGISTNLLSRYERRVHQVVSASGASPTIIVSYDDPQSPPDSVPIMAERPRHLIVVLDRGVYGYKPSWTYKSVGTRTSTPRLRFLEAVDVNDDGLVELFFAPRDEPNGRFTLILRFETDAWREMLRYRGGPCDG